MRTRVLLLVFSAALLYGCASDRDKSWTRHIGYTGTYSSPRTVDLNKDNVPDIIMGAGGQEEKYTDTAIIALDGVTGKMLWSLPGVNQAVGSAVFLDINKDSVPDVFIGGRWAHFEAIDGATGKLIWFFYNDRQRPDGSDGGWYNFTTPQIIPDQDGDGLNDLLVANGGDARAAPGNPNRPAGRILVIGSAHGKVIANAVVPDKKETYMSVVCEQVGDSINVLFGTGGETIGGHLYRVNLNAIVRGDISGAEVLAADSLKGFVSSPVLIDINKDGRKDIVVNKANATMLAIDGNTKKLLWQVHWPGTEAYTMPAPGNFTGDSIPDFFSNFAIGTFPKLNWSIRFMVDGSNGKVLFADTLPAFQYASAVVADLNGDGWDEALVNQTGYRRRQFDNLFYSNLLAFDFRNNTRFAVGDTLKGTNLASTPWIGDLDNDGSYDIIYSAVEYENPLKSLDIPIGLVVRRYATGIKVTRLPDWGGFMGRR